MLWFSKMSQLVRPASSHGDGDGDAPKGIFVLIVEQDFTTRCSNTWKITKH